MQHSVDGITPRRQSRRPERPGGYVKRPSAYTDRRQASSPAPFAVTLKAKRKIKTNRSLQAPHVLMAFATLLFAAGALVTVQGFMTNHAVASQISGSGASHNTSVSGGLEDVSEDKPTDSATSAYRVSPDNPRVLTISKLGVSSRIVSLGVDTHSTILTPTNIYDTGWYNGSARLGGSGATLLVGHVSGPSKPGVFSNLKDLRAVDTFSVERGDGKVFSYRVAASESVPLDKVDMVKALASVDPQKSGLNIMTCTGKYITSQKTYDRRLIVYAVLE